MIRRRILVVACAPGALLVAACFPDYRVEAAAGEAGSPSDSGSGTDAGGATEAGGTFDAGGPVLVGSTSGYVAYPAPTTLTISYPVQHAGDLIVLGTYVANANVTVTGVSDTLGTTFQHAPSQASAPSAACSGYEMSLQIWYANAAGSGDDSIALVHGGTDAFGAFLLEYAGLAQGGRLDGTSATGTVTAGATMSAGPLTTTGAQDVVVALFADFAAQGTMGAGTGFVAEQVDPQFAAMIEDDAPGGGGPGMHEATATLPGDSDAGLACWLGVSAAFE